MSGTRSWRVFLSYTGEDLEVHAAAARAAIRKVQHIAIDHRDSGATGEQSVTWCMSQVADCDILVVITAHRYGWVPSKKDGGNGKSISWMEFEQAQKLGLIVLPY